MTLLGLVAVLLGILTARFAMIERTRAHVGLFAVLFVAHLVGMLVYFAYVQQQGGDSELYYYDELDFYNRGFALGTGVMIYFVQFSRELIGGTYLDYFLLFNTIGFAGIALLMRIYEEVYLTLDTEQQPAAYLVMFLPSLQFWTCAIGKDAPLFFAASLSLWAALNIRRRFIWLGLAIGLMVLIRPHIALVAVTAAAIAMLFDKTLSRWARTGLLFIAVVAAAFAVATIQSALRLDLTDADSISTFLEARDAVSQSAAGGNTSVQGSFVVRMFSLLFRPFFFDVEDLFGYIASVENAALVVIFGIIILRMPILMVMLRRSPFVRYAAALSIGIAVVLALSYYNVGLGLRQRTMFLPGVLSLLVMLLAVRSQPREDLRAAVAG